MDIWMIFLTILHVAVSFLLILVVLAQQGKGQDLASAFGGGGSSAAFGARGAATFLAKVTTVCAVLFMLTSLGFSWLRPVISGGSVVPLGEPPAESLPAGVGPEETPPPEGTGAPEEGAAAPEGEAESRDAPGEAPAEGESEQPPDQQ